MGRITINKQQNAINSSHDLHPSHKSLVKPVYSSVQPYIHQSENEWNIQKHTQTVMTSFTETLSWTIQNLLAGLCRILDVYQKHKYVLFGSNTGMIFLPGHFLLRSSWTCGRSLTHTSVIWIIRNQILWSSCSVYLAVLWRPADRRAGDAVKEKLAPKCNFFCVNVYESNLRVKASREQQEALLRLILRAKFHVVSSLPGVLEILILILA